ncbi:restriction endonuclease subunit S [Polaribacter litorisediminis]|uniref:restriction endonuclease subunit S n=1 Tax=Polaribacter litorisediminis TaxID=1908341 RepID=UPI001CBD7567|nr:restriction endonuclease subunit S [Polaribacter litorisediminis]UAM99591.1 restriction endonuclease subunit S [Polaribacter litorisediminis]
MNSANLESVSKVITKGTTPTTVGGKFTSKGVNFVKSDSVGQFKHLDNSLFQFIDEKTDEKLKRSRLKENDLLFSIAGAYLGKLSIVRKKDLPANTNQAVGIVRIDKAKADVHYLYYFFSQNNINRYINNLSSQSSQPNLNLGLLGDLKFSSRSLSTQKQIAKVLSDLDTKIEINNKINQELEAMAKTLYDYWFVQFDFPDKNGKPYKSSGGEMVFNEELKREIPEGWEVKKLSSFCKIVDCLHSKKSDYLFENREYYLLQLENIKQDGLIDLSKKYFVSKEEYKRWTTRIEVKENDLVITNAGRVAGLAQIPKGVKAGIGRNITAIRPETINPTFLYYTFQGAEMQRQIKLNTDTGSFFKSLNVRGIKELLLVKPPKDLEDKFEEISSNHRNKRELNSRQNQKLSELRDWLLPMLMNGQVSVGYAEQEVESLGLVAENDLNYEKEE